jgi:hypothetical protein
MEEMRIDIVDGFILPDELHKIEKLIVDLTWNPFEGDVYETKTYPSGISAELEGEIREILDERVLEQAYALTSTKLRISRAYVNGWKPNEISFPHKDMVHTTCLIYLNRKYDRKYGGETLFYDETGDAHYAITPTPMRAVFFDGWIEHKATSFNHLFMGGYRHTIAYKLVEEE